MSEAGVIHVVMPQMGESLAEGTIVRWLKAPGDRVARDESLFEISTDKVDTDVPAPAAGVLRQILAQVGETVSVGAPVAVIATDVAIGDDPQPAPAAAPAAGPATTTEEPGGHFKSSHAPQLVSFRRGRAAAGPAPAAASNRSFSPAVLDSARRGGVGLAQLTGLQGSGRGGRITKRDVQRFLETGGVRVSSAIEAGSAIASRDAVPAEYLYRPAEADRLEPMSPVRRKIAHHMQWSVRISPHATAQGDVDMTASAALLESTREAFRERTGAPLTYTVLAAAATVQALRDFPILNSSVVGDEIAFKPSVNLGIAVAVPDSDELIVPVIHRAEELALSGIARAMHDIATRARARRLRPEDVQGGTFTLTNPGMFGGITGTPILNQPQVGILGLGAIRKTAVVIDDAVAVRPVMAVALTFDHRATDGMVAFKFLARIRELLESPPAAWR